MDQTLLNPLNQLETSLNSLLTSLTSTNTFTSAPAATQSLLNADDALSSALIDLKQHQENYTHILALRAEADRLQTQLKDIIRTCVDLRNEIGDIHPSILDETDTEDEDEDEDTKVESEDKTGPSAASVKQLRNSSKQHNAIDYDTLLSFAARIGKHNAAAAIEAERQSNRRPTPAQSQPQSQNDIDPAIQPPPANGGDTQPIEPPETTAQPTTEESQAELAAINDTLATQRAARGMAFPIAEVLRLGALGRLQYLREQEGEDAVEKEVEKMIRDSEGDRLVKEEEPVKKEQEESVQTHVSRPAPQAAAPVQQQRTSLPTAPASLPPKPKVALDLDFPGSDDDDDD